MSSLRVGTGRVDITPPIGTWMQGYAVRDHGTEGIHDNLKATAVAVENGQRIVALLTCDLIGLDDATVDAVRRRASTLSGIDPQAIMVTCSHTHGGPATGRRSYTTRDEHYMGMLEKQLATAVAMAVKDLRSASALVGTGSVRIGVNRRAARDGDVVLGENPEGPIDPEVLSIRFDDSEQRTLAVVFNYACHGTTLGGDNYLVTADYIGYARSTLERALPEGRALSSFVNGAAGDINPHPSGSFDLARRHGLVLGAEALKASQVAREIDEPSISHCRVRAHLPLSRPPSLRELKADLTELKASLGEGKGKVRASPETVAKILWTEEMIRRSEKDEIKDHTTIEVQALRIGSVGIVGLPGEVFVEIGLEVKRRSPFEATIFAGYSNGLVGYIPTDGAILQGGYEPVRSCYYLMEQQFERGAERAVVSAALQALKNCKEESS